MITQGRPIRRLSRRARIVMILFVLPVLAFSVSTRSDDNSKSAEPAAGLQKRGAVGQTPIEKGAVKTSSRHSGEVITRIYAVGDLLRPIRRNSGAVTTADFAMLIDRIKQGAATGTWGDPGAITPYANNLSLVISHNQLGHEAVRAFLAELRKSAAGGPQ